MPLSKTKWAYNEIIHALSLKSIACLSGSHLILFTIKLRFSFKQLHETIIIDIAKDLTII